MSGLLYALHTPKARMDIQSLVNHSTQLPTVPAVTQRVIASFSSEDVTMGEIAELLETDPVLSAKLLRLANSAYFQVSRSIESVDEAIRILGMAMVRNLVLAGGMVGAFVNTPGIDLHTFWTYSLYTACSARWLAPHCRVNRDLVFTVGLIHGIGQLHLHSAAPAAMVALDQQLPPLHADRAAAEAQALGFHFLNVSAALARRWNFPQSLVDALEHIADPLAAPAFSEVAATVHLGAWHARNALADTPVEAMRQSYPAAVAERMGLSAHWIFPDTEGAKTAALPPIPALSELTHGLTEMLR